jgi:hypothetical protein
MSDTPLNPIENPSAYGRMKVGSYKLPGIITAISGADRKYSFDKQKAVGKGGASSVFKGEEIADSIKVTCSLVTVAHFNELRAFREGVMPARGKKPDALDVDNAILQDQGIKSVALKTLGQVAWQGGGLWTVEIEFTEYSPPAPTQTGAADKSKPGGPTKFIEPPQSARSDADKQLDELLKKAKDG